MGSGMGQTTRVRAPRLRLAGDRRESQANCVKGSGDTFVSNVHFHLSLPSFPTSHHSSTFHPGYRTWDEKF